MSGETSSMFCRSTRAAADQREPEEAAPPEQDGRRLWRKVGLAIPPFTMLMVVLFDPGTDEKADGGVVKNSSHRPPAGTKNAVSLGAGENASTK